jgi:hypothetical protein
MQTDTASSLDATLSCSTHTSQLKRGRSVSRSPSRSYMMKPSSPTSSSDPSLGDKQTSSGSGSGSGSCSCSGSGSGRPRQRVRLIDTTSSKSESASATASVTASVGLASALEPVPEIQSAAEPVPFTITSPIFSVPARMMLMPNVYGTGHFAITDTSRVTPPGQGRLQTPLGPPVFRITSPQPQPQPQPRVLLQTQQQTRVLQAQAQTQLQPQLQQHLQNQTQPQIQTQHQIVMQTPAAPSSVLQEVIRLPNPSRIQRQLMAHIDQQRQQTQAQAQVLAQLRTLAGQSAAEIQAAALVRQQQSEARARANVHADHARALVEALAVAPAATQSMVVAVGVTNVDMPLSSSTLASAEHTQRRCSGGVTLTTHEVGVLFEQHIASGDSSSSSSSSSTSSSATCDEFGMGVTDTDSDSDSDSDSDFDSDNEQSASMSGMPRDTTSGLLCCRPRHHGSALRSRSGSSSGITGSFFSSVFGSYVESRYNTGNGTGTDTTLLVPDTHVTGATVDTEATEIPATSAVALSTASQPFLASTTPYTPRRFDGHSYSSAATMLYTPSSPYTPNSPGTPRLPPPRGDGPRGTVVPATPLRPL